MKTSKAKTAENMEYAQRWLNRAIKDFNTFKKLVPFDKRTQKPVQCSDPALAVYLLQQSVEKAVKALAIASGQYKTLDFVNYYKHNSLGLILNLIRKICEKVQFLNLNEVADLIGLNLTDAGIRLSNLEDQVMEKSNFNEKAYKKLDFKKESIIIRPENMDRILDMLMTIRDVFLSAIRSAYQHMNRMDLNKINLSLENPELILKKFAEGVTSDLKINPLTNDQIEAQLEFAKYLNTLPLQTGPRLKRTDMISNYLGVWAFGISLYLLTYLTYAHESTSRYPERLDGSNEIIGSKIGCDDYNDNLSIVSRIGRIGYIASITLNEMPKQLEEMASFFTTKTLLNHPL
jgi:hypothetical protein